jgi:hypothetical protein
MLKRTSLLVAMVLSCCLGHAIMLLADEPKTGEKKDTLLYVRKDPPGAKVLLDGKELGKSDDLFAVPPGVGRIVVELDGYTPGTKDATIRAEGVTRIELTLKQQAGTAPQSVAKTAASVSTAEDAQFTARLPQGTIELVGITDYPATAQSKWWQPDGSPANLGPFGAKPMKLSLSPGQKPLAFLLRFPNLPAGASAPFWHIKPSTGRWWAPQVLDAHGERVPNYDMLYAEVDASAATASLRVGISVGEWETAMTQKPDSAGTSSFSRDGQQFTTTFQQATVGADADATHVTFTTTVSYGKWNKRLVAVTSDGSEYAPDGMGYIGENGTADFKGLPLSSVKEFRFQVRPYSWVEFKNIVIQSGQKTAAKVIAPYAPPAPSKGPFDE